MIGWAGESHLNSGKQQENIGARSPSIPSSVYGFPGAAPLSSYPAAKTALLTPNPKVFRSAGRSCAPPCTTHPSLPPAAHLLATASPPGEADQPAQKRLRVVKPPRTRSTRGREHGAEPAATLTTPLGCGGVQTHVPPQGTRYFSFWKRSRVTLQHGLLTELEHSGDGKGNGANALGHLPGTGSSVRRDFHCGLETSVTPEHTSDSTPETQSWVSPSPPPRPEPIPEVRVPGSLWPLPPPTGRTCCRLFTPRRD